MKALFLIDLQKEFCTKETEKVFDRIVKFVKTTDYKHVIATMYENNEESACYKMLNWKECMKGSTKLIKDIERYSNLKIRKDTYSKCTEELLQYVKENNITELHIMGVNTDACVLATAFDLFENNIEFKVIEEFCASTEGEDIHQSAIKVMKSALGSKRVVTLEELYNEGK